MEANKLMPLGEGAYRLKQFIWNGIDFIKHEILCMRSKARGPQTIKLSDRFFICGDGHGEFRAKFEPGLCVSMRENYAAFISTI
jgi:hypothetical protein